MIVTGDVSAVRDYRWSEQALTWGLVPTMGALHEGHLSLVKRGREENDRLIVSIFVNPEQFGRGEDLESYPRDIDRDLGLLADMGVDLVFTPSVEDMYPQGFQTTVTMEKVSKRLEGASRPGHFEGVATVVAKLFNIAQPTRAYFGQKDAQQAAVLKRLAKDLNFNLEVIACPTVREADGLAMSSRNVNLTPEQRAAASILHRALSKALKRLHGGERSGRSLRETMREVVRTEPLARIDYVSVANPETLEELEFVNGPALCSLAVFFDEVRLIDNMLLD